MMIFSVSAATILAWCFAVALLGAGIVNVTGLASVRENFARWGYPTWWNLVTGGLELLAAVLVAIPLTRIVGLGLGASICIAAVATLVRYREYAHVLPGIVLTMLAILDLAPLVT